MKGLYDKLREKSYSDYYPFHMPGHKRMVKDPFLENFPNPYSLDITEIWGFDNLHHPEGILKESMERIASTYGADKSYYLVNGSSSGILSAICGTTKCADTVIMSRNCHKSAYHGVFLNQLKVRYLYPQIVDDFGVQGGVDADKLEDLLKTGESVSAVFIVSPTYDGVISDIKRLSGVCHGYGIPLIVDEAHGAHFRYGEMFPKPALDLGADIVVQSLHKTLPSFTQTALLHVKKGYVDIEKIEYYLQIFQSSSPSYLLMAGMERCVAFMEAEGKLQMKKFEKNLSQVRKRLKEMKHLRLLDKSIVGSCGVYDLDDSKVVISSRGTSVNGQELMDELRTQYHLEMEMCGADYVTAITSVMDTQEGLKRLENAFMAIDKEADRRKDEEGNREDRPQVQSDLWRKFCTEPEMTLYEAWKMEKISIRLADSEGMISGEFVYLYPPGIPLIVPGETITGDAVSTILSYRMSRLPVQGLKDYNGEYIEILEKEGSCDILMKCSTDSTP
ncbi:MAG: aminotransferase class I/II-fold pyridoxal phosphate-dependent enzyme [Hungatella sp.]|nr:aminotransferase class I/II-fold pyridoxal phosphate-dependent enzyme [Hungatella sp.]